jgi:hypothetical protein
MGEVISMSDGIIQTGMTAPAGEVRLTTQDPAVFSAHTAPASPVLQSILWSPESWADYWSRKGPAFGRVAGSLFSILSTRDSRPGDGILDISSFTVEQLDTLFGKIEIVSDDEAPHEAMIEIGRRLRAHLRQNVAVLYAVRDSHQWVATDERGAITKLGPAWTDSLDQIRSKTGEGMIRVVVDRRLLARREGGLNPDRQGMMRAGIFDADLAVSGGIGMIHPDHELDLLPTRARASGIGPGELDAFILGMFLLISLGALVKRGTAAPVRAMGYVGREPRIHPRFADLEGASPSALARLRQWTTRGGTAPTAVMVPRGSLPAAVTPTPPGPALRPPQSPLSLRTQRLPPADPTILPDFVNPMDLEILPLGTKRSEGGVTLRRMGEGGIGYMVDARPLHRTPREGFICFPLDAEHTVFVPLAVARRAVETGEAQHFNTLRGGIFWVSPLRTMHPLFNHPFFPDVESYDRHGIVNELGIGRLDIAQNASFVPSVSFPWASAWARQSPMDYLPTTGPRSRFLPEAQQAFNPLTDIIRALSLRDRRTISDQLLKADWSRLTPPEQEALMVIALSVRHAKMPADMVISLADVLLEGEAPTRLLISHVAESIARVRERGRWDVLKPIGLSPQAEMLSDMGLELVDGAEQFVGFVALGIRRQLPIAKSGAYPFEVDPLDIPISLRRASQSHKDRPDPKSK